MTERRKHEFEISAAILDTAPSMLAYWDRDLTCRYANSAYLEWFGVTGPSLIGTSIRDLLGPDLFARNEPYMYAALRGEAQEFERLVPGPLGIMRPSLAAYLPHIVDGEVLGFVVQVTDVTLLHRGRLLTEQKAREAAHTNTLLRKVQDELKLAQQLGEMGSWCWEIDEDIISWSGQLYVLFGLDETRQPPTFAEHGSLYTPQSFALLENAVERAIQIGQPYHIEVEYIHRTGRRGWLDVRGAAERDVTGRVFRLHGTAQEITGMRVAREASGLAERISHLEACLAEEKGRNQQLEKAAADGSRLGAVGLIASGIAHDYNNVLTSLAVIMELLQSTSDESRSIYLAGQGKEAIDRASSLTRRLINVGRPQLAISTVAKLAEVLKSSQEVIGLAAGGLNQIEFDLSVDVEVVVDAHELEIAVLNLVINARDAMDTPGKIRVSLEFVAEAPIASEPLQTSKWVAVTVADTGKGMSAESLRLACEPFYTTKGVDRGTGLGLAMVNAFASNSGGKLVLDSTLEQGTTARIVLPVHCSKVC